MPPRLEMAASELAAAAARAHRLADGVDEERWGRRPAAASWSAAECLLHLNVTSEAFLPPLGAAIAEGRRRELTGGGPHRRDFAGWLLCRSLEPPYRIRTRTPARFVPAAVRPKGEAIADFDRLQGELTALVRAADGLDLGRIKIASPFNARLRYNLLSAFSVLAVHQRRHLWQAERAVAQI